MSKLLSKIYNRILGLYEKIKYNVKPYSKIFFRQIIKNWVVIIAVMIAVISCFFVKPDRKYLYYPQYKTLCCLLSLMLVLRGFKDTKIFKIFSARILEKITDLRYLAYILVFLPAIFALFITNDVAALSFIPFTIVLLSMADCQKFLPRILILQTMTCRLSGMISPIGNAQNLFLLDYYNFSAVWFIANLWPLAVAGILLTFIGCLTVPHKHITILPVGKFKIPYIHIAIYVTLFLVTVFSIFNLIPYYIAVAMVILTMLYLNRKAFLKAKYSIIIMFLAFFVLAGNLKRMPEINTFLTEYLAGREYISAVVASQVMTNTPVALLFPKFSENYLPLIFGINVGKYGTSQLSNYMLYSLGNKYDLHHKFGRKILAVSFIYLIVLFSIGYAYLRLFHVNI